jgi:hypothetical protein
MGYISTSLSRSRAAFDRCWNSLSRQSRRILSKRRLDVGSRLNGTKAYVKKYLRQSHRKLRSFLGKVAAKRAASSR